MSEPFRRSETAIAYWKENVRLLITLLIIWALVSFGFGIFLAPLLNHIVISGVPLGFWFAQQGAIYVFIALIFTYVVRMNALDRKYDVHEE